MEKPKPPKSAAEEFLVESGLINRRSHAQRAVLGCLSCRWLKINAPDDEAAVFSYNISRCTGIGTGAVIPILQRFENAGVISSKLESMDASSGRRPPRRLYTVSDSELGSSFKEHLDIPPVCKLDEPVVSQESTMPELDGNIAAAEIIINASNPSQLESIIALAQHRLSELNDRD